MINDKIFINIAKEIASASKCVSKQVGAVIVKEGRILSTGYNGTPAGFQNCCEYWNGEYTKEHHEWRKTYEIHAEMNALMNALYSGVSLKDSTLYVYGLPVCPSCTKCVIQAGIKRVVIPTAKTNKANWQEVWERESAPMFEESGVQVTILGV
jgi:dCMP deaminase